MTEVPALCPRTSNPIKARAAGFTCIADCLLVEPQLCMLKKSCWKRLANKPCACMVRLAALAAVDEMAKKISPSVELFWRNFILSQLGSQYSRRLAHPPGWHPTCSRGLPEADDWLRGGR